VEAGSLQLRSDNETTVAEPVPSPLLSNFDLQAVFTMDGPPDAQAGLRFRAWESSDGEHAYLFLISDHAFSFTRQEGDQARVLASSDSEFFVRRKGYPNLLRVIADGASIRLFINGWPVAYVDDEEPTSGSMGIVATQGAQVVVRATRVSTLLP
jgi:hypothetical protein